VLDWRVRDAAPTDPGPLPWLPGVPNALLDHPVWDEYLTKRSELVTHPADQGPRPGGPRPLPLWAPQDSHPTPDIIGEVAVWGAANGIDCSDRRPTGPGHLRTAPAMWQQHLDWTVAHFGDEPGTSHIQERPATRNVGGLHYDDRQLPHQAAERRPNGPPPGR
jgi:hypothetical protein